MLGEEEGTDRQTHTRFNVLGGREEGLFGGFGEEEGGEEERGREEVVVVVCVVQMIQETVCLTRRVPTCS